MRCWTLLILTRFASMARRTASKSIVWGLPNLAWLLRFLQPKQSFFKSSSYCTWINCTMIFHPRNVFGCFHSLLAQIVKQKFPNWTMLHVHLCNLQIIHTQWLPWLHLCRGVNPPPPKRVSWYDTKQSDGEVPVMLGVWGIRSTPSLALLLGPLWSGVVAPDRALSMG